MYLAISQVKTIQLQTVEMKIIVFYAPLPKLLVRAFRRAHHPSSEFKR